MADRLLQAWPGPSATAPITNTTFAIQAPPGVLVPVDPLRVLIARPKLQLCAWLLPPAGGSIEMVVAIQEDVSRLVPLTGTAIRATAPAAGPAWTKVGGGVVEVTAHLAGDLLSLRLLARVSTGTGDYATPTLILLGP